MSQQKAAKLLAKALNNSSKEEACAAFGMAWTYASRASITLSSIHTIEAKEPDGISADRERELVEKYNALLIRAQDLKGERDSIQASYTLLSCRHDALAAELKTQRRNNEILHEHNAAFWQRVQNAEAAAARPSNSQELADALAQIIELRTKLADVTQDRDIAERAAAMFRADAERRKKGVAGFISDVFGG